jgi:hypothetical protein
MLALEFVVKQKLENVVCQYVKVNLTFRVSLVV